MKARCLSARAAAALLPLLLIAAQPALADTTAATHHVRKGDIRVVLPMTVGGTFEAKTTEVRGTFTLAEGGKGAVPAEVTVDLASLDTGIELRNRHLKENYLEVGKGEGFAAARLTDIQLDAPGDAAAFEGKTGFAASFQLHGTSVPVKGTAEVKKVGDLRQVVASFPIKVSDFAIAKPTYLGVGVKNEIKVEVVLDVAPVAGDPS
jgi:polyisoprenoid-binding protein YceI